MKRSLVRLVLVGVLGIYDVSHAIGSSPSPGTRVWDIAREDNLISNTLESKVCQLAIDFASTFTALDTVLSKMSIVESKAELIATQVDAPAANFNLDLSKVCAIEDTLHTIQLNLEAIDTAGTFTALGGLKRTVCSKIELLNMNLQGTQGDIANLTATEIDHTATIASQLGLLNQGVASINSILDMLNFDAQFNTACSLLDVIDSCLQTVESKVGELGIVVVTDFAGTFTALDANFAKACTIESLVDAIPMSFMADLSGTFSALNALEQKICTIESKVDDIDMSIMSVESNIDILDTTLDMVISKLCVLESKTDTIIDSICFSLFDNAIQLLGQDCSVLEELNNNQMLEKACTIESNLDVITSDLLTQESKLEVIEQELNTIASKVCAIQMDNTAISKLCLVDSKLDVAFDTALTIESIIDNLVGIESSIDALDDLSETILSKLCVTEDDTQTVCSHLDLLVSSLDITESKLDLLLTPSAGNLCLDFGSNGTVTTNFGGLSSDVADSVVIQSDGKIIAAGQTTVTGSLQFGLARYNSDGSLDATFDSDGLVVTSFGAATSQANVVALYPGDKIIAAGTSNALSGFDFALARYNSDGSLDTTFDGDGLVLTNFGDTVVDEANAVLVQSDGKIVAVGQTGVGVFDFALARYNDNGVLDTSFGLTGTVATAFGAGSNDVAHAALLQPDGKIVAIGQSNVSGTTDFALARYNSDGNLDTSFDGDGRVVTDFGGSADRANAGLLQPDGKIIAIGQSDASGSNDFALARYTSDGSLDTTFGTGGLVTTPIGVGTNDVANGGVLQPDGKIIAVGGSLIAPGNTAVILVRYNIDGSLDSSFGAGGIASLNFGSLEVANAATLQTNGRIIAAGFSNLSGNTDFLVACFESGLLPIWFVKEEVELLSNQIEHVSTSTLISKLGLIEDQVCTIESTLDIVSPLIGVLNMQAQELMGDFQETWTVLQVIEDKVCTSESVLNSISNKLESNLDTLEFSGVFTAIEAIDNKARIVDSEVNTYESLVDALGVDFSGVFTVLDVIESKICLADDFVQSISAGLEDVQDALGIPIFQSDVGTTGFVVPASGRYYLAEDIMFEPTVAVNGAIDIDTVDNVTIDLNNRFIRMPDSSTATAAGIRVLDSSNVRIMNGTLDNFTSDGISVDGSPNILISNMVCINARDSGDGMSISFESDNGIIENCSCQSNNQVGIQMVGSAASGAQHNLLIKNCTCRGNSENIVIEQASNVCIENTIANESVGGGTIGSDSGIVVFIGENIIIKDCVIEENLADGITIDSDVAVTPLLANCHVDILDCVIANNTVNGINLNGDGGPPPNPAINISAIMKNTITNNGTFGLVVDPESLREPNDNIIAFNSFIENGTTNVRAFNGPSANTYLGNFAYNSTAVGDPDNTNYNIDSASDITRKFVTVSQTSSFSDEPTEWHNINMLP